jgi:membrane protease YdiL (CAAX protease family)
LGCNPIRMDLPGRCGSAFVLSLSVVVIETIVTWYGPASASITFNIALVALLLVSARVRGVTWSELGFAPEHVVRSLAWGGILSVIAILAIIGVAWGWPSAFAEANPPADPPALVAVLLRVLAATALAEEIVFRGVLQEAWGRAPGVRGSKRWERLWGLLIPAIATGAFFALWHIGPTRDMLAESGRKIVASAFVLPLALTAAAGIFVLGPLREWTRSLAGPTLLHFVVNGGVILAAYQLGCPANC